MFGKKKPTAFKSNRLNEMLNAPDKQIAQARGFNGVLTMLWRKILFDLQMNGEYFNYLLETFIRTQASVFMPKADKSSLKGNLIKDFTRNDLTLRGLMKAVLVLRVSGFDLQIRFRYRDKPGISTTHTVSVDLSPYYEPGPEFDKIYKDERIETTTEILDRVEDDILRAADLLSKATQHSKEQQ